MTRIDFYFDVISPYAYLAFEQLPATLQGISHSLCLRPVLFAGLLKHHGQLGPAEIAPKKEWTFRQVNWQALQSGVPLVAPLRHPFNPLALNRLMLALGPGEGTCNRFVAESVFRHVWAQQTALDASDPERLASLATHLLRARQHAHDEASVGKLLAHEGAKSQLKANTDQAIALQLFGVPSFVVGRRVFWGADSQPMLRAHLLGDPWFESAMWHDAAPAIGIKRSP